MFIKERNFEKVISGNLKKKKAGHSVNVYMTNDQIEKLNKICSESGAIRNRYVGEALEHYWKCMKDL